MYFTIEMLSILEKLHAAQIIHGDIKPDNFLIQKEPGLNTDASDAHSMFKDVSPTLEAIDFGISIDMSLFKKGQSFDHQFDKVTNRCPEMLEKRSWNYHVITHSSEIRCLRSTKCSSKTPQNLLYFMYRKTHVVFFVFHFKQLYIFT